jgi:hypothetical protein
MRNETSISAEAMTAAQRLHPEYPAHLWSMETGCKCSWCKIRFDHAQKKRIEIAKVVQDGINAATQGLRFTVSELEAFEKLFEYCRCEWEDYQSYPVVGHIWLEIEKAKAAVERVSNGECRMSNSREGQGA